MSARPPPLPVSPPPLPRTNADLKAKAIVASTICGVLLMLLVLLVALARQTPRDASPIGTNASVESGLLGSEDSAATNTQASQVVVVPPISSRNESGVQTTESSLPLSTPDGDPDTVENINAEIELSQEHLARNYVDFPKFDGIGSAQMGPILSPGTGNPFLAAGDSRSTVFVVDVSGSMDHGRRKRVFSALVDGIESLNSSQKFLVLLFDDQVYNLKTGPGLIEATVVNKRAAITWINDFTSGGGGTEPLEAMLYALAQKPERIMVLSDGEFDPNYVQHVTTMNTSKKPTIRIDTIGLSEVVEVLQDLARNNGGIYYQAQ